MDQKEIEEIREVSIEISKRVSPTPVDDNYWRNMLNKAFDTPYELTAYELYELGRFSERLVAACGPSDDDKVLKVIALKRYFSSIINYSTDTEKREHCGIIAIPVRNGENIIHMAFADCQARIVPSEEPEEGEKKEEVGMVGGTMAGAYELQHRKKRLYFNPSDAWNALCSFFGAKDDMVTDKKEESKTDTNE